jgi:hypothetical protein
MENKGVWIERARTELGVWGRGEGGNTEKIEILKKWGHTEKTEEIPVAPMARGMGNRDEGDFFSISVFSVLPLKGAGFARC